ncbi:protein turtle homolog B-like [Schistocerca gregaria]|uniref:protein turtle homolog B-like n=1 Tax=Schistocerca gregaria TaxID=7010 RepID=UPI00211F15EC|nr:protein turtle homolog B-like [Schistocerca gregaria]
MVAATVGGMSLVACAAIFVQLASMSSVALQSHPQSTTSLSALALVSGSGPAAAATPGKLRHEGGGSGASAAAAGNTLAAPSVFVTSNSTVVVAQEGGTATLPCVLRKFASGVVSWIRRKDYHLLTVGLATYSSDDRFLVVHARHLQSWGLQIKFVQPRDAGWYECQVSTHPPTSIFVELKVTEAVAEIAGAPDLHLRSGSELRLICKLRRATEAPVFVFWYHDDRMINYDEDRGVAVSKGRGGSQLLIPRAERTDSGNYTCAPSNARAASITVHVLEAEKPAPMQQDTRKASTSAAAAAPWPASTLFLTLQQLLLLLSLMTLTPTSWS